MRCAATQHNGSATTATTANLVMAAASQPLKVTPDPRRSGNDLPATPAGSADSTRESVGQAAVRRVAAA